MLAVVFRATASTQVVDARAWYDNQRQGLGAEFSRCLESAVNRVARNPLSAPVVHQDVRRVLLKRFPYSVFYMVEGDSLLVLGCMHTRRMPADWVG
jgi:ParE toxin of type II toxin-antitoxin system, parDE